MATVTGDSPVAWNMVFTQGRCGITFHVAQRGLLLVNCWAIQSQPLR